jgi:hypothetical protein
MREDVQENMEPPGEGLPYRLPEYHPQEREHEEEDDQTVRHTVCAMDVSRENRRIRGFVAKMWTLSKSEEDGDVKGAERY